MRRETQILLLSLGYTAIGLTIAAMAIMLIGSALKSLF
jgi:hypothetical protein